jgi:hypothetical protein
VISKNIFVNLVTASIAVALLSAAIFLSGCETGETSSQSAAAQTIEAQLPNYASPQTPPPVEAPQEIIQPPPVLQSGIATTPQIEQTSPQVQLAPPVFVPVETSPPSSPVTYSSSNQKSYVTVGVYLHDQNGQQVTLTEIQMRQGQDTTVSVSERSDTNGQPVYDIKADSVISPNNLNASSNLIISPVEEQLPTNANLSPANGAVGNGDGSGGKITGATPESQTSPKVVANPNINADNPNLLNKFLGYCKTYTAVPILIAALIAYFGQRKIAQAYVEAARIKANL